MANLPTPGEILCGFTTTETGIIQMLGARTVEFFHGFSGARLLYIQNDDPELGFNIIYRTPQFDESDANHILEHLLLCSCPKYPSRDVFFDMDSKSYATFMNGITDNAYTCYPICSQSENQLLRLTDVTLCCMEEPDGLTNRNFFLREGIRFELESPESPLVMQGTVLNEDLGHLTDLQENADSHMARALYPGLTAANLLGRAHLHYREVTFEKVKDVFDRCYNYSNCLIILYGNMDLHRMLSFLDREHLSRYPSRNVSLLPLMTQETPGGYTEVLAESPAYKGSDPEEASIIDYAIDLSHCSQEELIWWDLTADMLDNETSVFHELTKKAGLNRVLEVYVNSALAKPALTFRLHNGDAGERGALKRCAIQTLEALSLHGIPRELFLAAAKENRMTDLLTREAPHLGFSLSEEIGRYWSLTGKTDYFSLYEQASGQFSHDEGQSIIRRLAANALTPEASALVVTTPAPGLAEQLEREKALFLREKKAGMTTEEIRRLMTETAKFRKWNMEEKANMDFLIQPEELPLPEETPFFYKKDQEGITYYLSPAPAGAIGSYQLFFDLSGIPAEDWNYLTIYQLLLTELDTKRFSSMQQKNLEQSLLHDCTFDELYPGYESGENHHPMLSVFWYALTEDFEQSLDFLLDIMGKSDYEDMGTIIRILDKYTPDYDQSKAENAPSLAYSLAESYIRQDSRFRYLLNSPEVYYFLKDTCKRLKRDSEFCGFVAEKLRSIARGILNRNRLVFLAAAEDGNLEEILQVAARQLGRLAKGRSETIDVPETVAGEPVTSTLFLPPHPRRIAACVDSPSQEIRLLGDFRGNPDFKGRYLPFLLAAGDKYLKPAIRYSGGAYDSGIDFLLPAGYFTLWSTADPQIASTVEIFQNTGAQLAALPISDEDLKGYILSAYAQSLPPSGMLSSRMRAMRRDLMGIDTVHLNEMISDIKKSSLADQADAARVIDQLLKKGPLSVVGNETPIIENKALFDKIMHVRRRG